MHIEHFIYYLIGINLLTFILYASDKRLARKRQFRISEKTLLLFALAGGSPAAWIAQKIFRHKTKKSSFRIRFWLIVIFQIAALVYYYVKYGI